MASALNGRIAVAPQKEKHPFKIIWDGQVFDMDAWVMAWEVRAKNRR